jgi:sarcosine oxidase subunit beta
VSASGRMPAAAHHLVSEAETVIIGGGIMGLGIAYELARRGRSDVHVLEQELSDQRRLGSQRRRRAHAVVDGAEHPADARVDGDLSRLCLRAGHQRLAATGRLPVLDSQSGRAGAAGALGALQNRCGVPTRILTPQEALRIVPELNPKSFVAACYNPRDGVVFPWPFLWGYAHAASELGVQLHTYTKVTAIDVLGPAASVVHTSKGQHSLPTAVINAAGAWSPAGRQARRRRASQPPAPSRDPRHRAAQAVPKAAGERALDSGLYFSQSMRGEIVGGITVPDRLRRAGSARLAAAVSREDMAAELVSLMPRAAAGAGRCGSGPVRTMSRPTDYPILGASRTRCRAFIWSAASSATAS